MSLSIFSRSSGTLPDQPITNLPASEEAAIATLSSRLTIFTTKILHPTDPWLSLAYAEQKRLLLRFLRFHLLNVPKAENHILRVCCWRTSTRPWTLPLRVLRGRAVGLPLCHPSGRGREKEVLIFLPASQYVRADVDHAKQQVAVKAFFEFCAYADDGLRASAAVLLIDFGDLQMRNVDLASARYSIKLFMDYYPEVFCKILFINYPKWFYGTWKCLTPLLDARTVAKVAWLPNGTALQKELAMYFEIDQLPKWLGGKLNDPLELYTGATLEPDEWYERLLMGAAPRHDS